MFGQKEFLPANTKQSGVCLEQLVSLKFELKPKGIL